MNSRVLYLTVGLLIGLAIGFAGANALNRRGMAVGTANNLLANPNTAPQPNQPQGGMQADVAATLERAENNPEDFVAQMKAGDMYAQIGRFDKAAEFYKRGVSLEPQNPAANLVLANALFDARDFVSAAEYYSKVLEIDPSNLNARTDLGTTFVERQQPDFERAIVEYEKVLQQDPKNEPALYYLAIANLRKGNRPEAERILTKLLEISPTGELASRLKRNLDQK